MLIHQPVACNCKEALFIAFITSCLATLSKRSFQLLFKWKRQCRNIFTCPQSEKMLVFFEWSPFKKCCKSTCPTEKISMYEVTYTPTIIGEFSINNEKTTPMDTELYLSLAISFKSLYSPNIFLLLLHSSSPNRCLFVLLDHVGGQPQYYGVHVLLPDHTDCGVTGYGLLHLPCPEQARPRLGSRRALP